MKHFGQICLVLLFGLAKFPVLMAGNFNTEQASLHEGHTISEKPVPPDNSGVPTIPAGSLYSAGAGQDTTIIINKIYPKDTLERFLAYYGKDSLVKQIDRKLAKTVKLITPLLHELADEYYITELRLFGQHFNLGFDTLKYPLMKSDVYFFKLYGNVIGKSYDLIDTSEIKKSTAETFHDFFIPAFNDSNISDKVALPLALYALYIDLSNKTLDTLYAHYKKFNTEDSKWILYYALSEYGNNHTGKRPLVEPYTNKLMDSVYRSNNYPATISNFYNSKNKFRAHTSLLETNKMLAYGLYAGDITLKKNGLDLMYLLAAMHESGGWNTLLPTFELKDIRTSIYGLWALCEFRAKLLEME